ncbi:MAG TPA: hypothetical protein VJC37_08550 [Planctomycetota bacterium]|nr:hypothetical protein [Planctomycetota bacterium]
MKLNRAYGLLAGVIVASAILLVGCKSGSVKPPAEQPVPAPVTKEAPKTPVLPVVTMVDTSDAKSFLKQASENSLNAKSFSSEIVMDIEMMGMKMALTFDIAKSGDTTYTSGEFMGMRFEGYSDGKNLAMLDPMSRRWARVPPEQKDMMMSLEQVQRKIYGAHLQDAAFATEEKIQDKPYHVIDATVKPEAFNDILAGQNNPMQGMDVKFDKTTLRIWIEKDTGLIYKTVLNMEATMTGDIPGLGGQEGGNDIEDEEEAPESKTPVTKPEDKKPEETKTTKIKYEIEINNSDYNKVAPIVIPDEVKKLLETPVSIEPTNK